MKSAQWYLLAPAVVAAFLAAYLLLVVVLGRIGPVAPDFIDVAGAERIELDGGRVRFQRSGVDSTPMVFLHGFNNQLAAWNGTWPHLANCGGAVRLDIPGYGGSEWPSTTYALPEQAARVVAFLDARRIGRVTLVGSSMGGSLAAWIAATRPERVKALMLVAPSGYPGSLQFGGRLRILYRPGLVNAIATRMAASRLYRRLHPSSRLLQALSVTGSYGDAWAAALHDIRAPTLVVWSLGDPAVPFSYADSVTAAIPHAALLPLPVATGHEVTVRQPALLGELACRLHAGESPENIATDVSVRLSTPGEIR